MFLRLSTIEIGKDTFEDRDLLDRGVVAHRLTELVDRVEDPLVIALDGPWGSGKSHFLKLWVGEHKKKEGKSALIYFDAFAHDFLNDPLASLVICLSNNESSKASKFKAALEKMKMAAKRISFPVARIASSFASAGMSDLLAGATQSAAAELENVLGFYWKNEESRIAQMKEFKQALCQLSAECRIVIIVDELDRCRPDYSLSLLEVIKHFFEVPSVHFVLGVNIDALKSSVSVRYGAGFDAGLYLQKFVNLTMSLPESENDRSPQRYFDRVIENLRADGHSLSKRKSLLGEAEEAIKLSGFKNALTLRGVERLLNRLALFPVGLDSCAWPDRNHPVATACLISA